MLFFSAQGSKSIETSKIPASTPQKPAAYRPPHAKNADSVKAEVFTLLFSLYLFLRETDCM